MISIKNLKEFTPIRNDISNDCLKKIILDIKNKYFSKTKCNKINEEIIHGFFKYMVLAELILPKYHKNIYFSEDFCLKTHNLYLKIANSFLKKINNENRFNK